MTSASNMSRLALTFPDFIAQLGGSDFRDFNKN